MGMEYCHIKSIYNSPKQWDSDTEGFSFPNFLKQRAFNYENAQGKSLPERGPIYNTKEYLPERFIVIL